MKKTLVAIAAAAAVTGAMAEATLSGFVQIGTNATQTTTAGVATSKTTLEDSNANTALNFTDVEDLGDGLKLTTVIGLLPSIGSSSTLGGQTTFAALSGGFGELKAGKFGNDQFWTVVAGDATGYMGNNAAVVNLAFGSTAATTTTYTNSGVLTTSFVNSATTGSSEVWTANQIRYQLPTFVSGLTVAYTNKVGSQTTNIYGAETVLVGYTTGGFNAQVATTQYKPAVCTTDTLTAIAASYDFGVAKLYALSTSAKIQSVGTVTGKNLGVSVPMGAFTLMYNNSTADGYLSNRAITAVSQSNSEVAVTYGFSKRTTGWIYYTKYDGASAGQNGGGTASTTTSNGFNSVRLMLLHSF